MPLSAAEKQRRYRERRDADPGKRLLYLEKEKLSWLKKKATGKVKLAGDMSERDIRSKRKYWRKAQTESRLRQRARVNAINMTPPRSPDDAPLNNVQAGVSTARFSAGRKRVRRDRASCYRQLQKLKTQLAAERRKSNKYKKRFYRHMGTHSQDSPRTKTKNLLRHLNKGNVRKTLNFHYALMADLREKYNNTTEERSKQLFARVITGRIVKKYRLQKFAMKSIGFSQRRWKMFNKAPEIGVSSAFLRQRKTPQIIDNLKKVVHTFFTRDDVSRITPGKKQTLTRHKIKMQKRLLSDTLKVLHLKFIAEHPQSKLSYSLFCKLRPFYVVVPSESDRETCLCRTHENMDLITDKLRKLKILPANDLSEMVNSLACDPSSIDCMYGNCTKCKSRKVPIPETFDPLEQVEYFQWVSEKEERMTTAGMKDVRITKKEKQSHRLMDVIDEFHSQLRKYQRHVFNIRHQFKSMRLLHQSLDPTECILQVDFAENYLCRYSSEIQSVHFGASHQQATLHDAVLHVGSIENAISFCTVSDSTQHDPPAIWEYMGPVMEYIRTNFPGVLTIHFYSDGPATQYRQKKNFYLFSTKIFDYGFVGATWNFFEAGHGKGAPDGVGGAVKRTADRHLRNGTDIPDASTFFNILRTEDSSMNVFYVDSSKVDAGTLQLSENIPPIQGTMGIHQIITKKRGVVTYRQISCFCGRETSILCACDRPKTFIFPGHSAENENPNSVEVIEEFESFNTSDDDMLGKWCVVRYEGGLYPGIICDVDEVDVEVKCMACIGVNGFFWPMIEDVIWYRQEDIVCLIPEPNKVGSRHVEIDREIWLKIYPENN